MCLLTRSLFQEGVFDQCLEDIEGVQHIASPLTGNPDGTTRSSSSADHTLTSEIVALIGVAVNGTMSLLKSIAAHGYVPRWPTFYLDFVISHSKRVKRVVITSSAAALMGRKAGPSVYGEVNMAYTVPSVYFSHGFSQRDWNQSALQPLPENATPIQKYYASKTLAEKSAWDFVEGKHFDLVTILPPLVNFFSFRMMTR